MGKGMFHTLKITQELSPLLHGDAQVLNAVGGCQEQVLAGKDNLILNRGHKYGKRNGLPKVKFNQNCHPSFMEMLQYRMPWEVVKNRTLQVKTIKCLTGVINMGKGMFNTLKITQELSPLLHGDARVSNAVGGCQEQDLAGINIIKYLTGVINMGKGMLL